MIEPAAQVLSADRLQDTRATQASSANSRDSEMFLKLLTTQLRNQDPTNPADATEYVAQIATFTQVEQLVQMNSGMSALQALLSSALGRLDLSYVGREVEAKVSEFRFDGDSVSFTYASAGAAEVEIVVLDRTGTAVFSMEGDPEAGEHSFEWDGRGDDGTVLPAGSYRIEARAKDASGRFADAVVSIRGVVDEVITENGASLLVLGNGTTVDSSMVVAARNPAAA